MEAKYLRLLALLGLSTAVSCGAPVNHNSKKSHNRLELAKDFLTRRDLATAGQEARHAIEFNPDNAEAYQVLGLIDMMEALNNFRLLEIDDCLTGIDAEGLRLEMEQHLKTAGSSFDRATQIDPKYSEAYSNWAQTFDLLEEYDKAVELGMKALEVPHRLTVLGLTRANLGWAKFHTGDDVGAAKDLRQALQFNPNMCVAKYRLGRVYFRREEWNKALGEFRVVVMEKDCGMQEAHYYYVQTMRHILAAESSSSERTSDLGVDAEGIDSAVEACVALAPRSCIASRCLAGAGV